MNKFLFHRLSLTGAPGASRVKEDWWKKEGQLEQALKGAPDLAVEKRVIQRMSGLIALLSLITLLISFYFLPGIELTNSTFILMFGLGIMFFILYLLLPHIYLNETFLMISDGFYIALITFAASRAGDYGILVLFLYFVIIAADAMKYPISEYVLVVILTVQAAFLYIVIWSPFSSEARIGIATLFIFSIVSMAVFVWYFAYQFFYERSLRYVLEKKSKYLKAVNDHLKAVDAMRTNILNVTSHEFQTPLSIVRNSLANLKDNDLGQLTPKQLHYLEVAAESNERIIHLVKDLLNASRVESGRWELLRKEVDLVSLVNELMNEYEPLCKLNKLALTATLPDKPIPVEIDDNLMRVAFKNLLDNAVKYTPAGGSITVTLRENKDRIDFSVTDTGIGIDKKMRPHLFTQFSRSDEAILAKPEGYGIGLYYAKAIVSRHGGEIDVVSQKGKGATFIVHLPKNIIVDKEGHYAKR